MHTKINWFEIPATDFSRAVKFYESIFDTMLKVETIGGPRMGIFTSADGDSVGCVIQGEQFTPSENGAVLYLDAGRNMDAVLERIGTAGGNIVLPKTELPRQLGYIAHFRDSEGNRVALHAEA